MSHARTPKYVYLLVGVTLPGIALLGGRFVGSGAANAHAQPGSFEAPMLPSSLSKSSEPSPDVKQMLDFGRRLTHDRGIPSPFESATVLLDDIDESGTASARSGSSASGVRVTGILIQADRTIAVIDGKAFQPDDEVAPGWRLDRIDHRASLVQLRHASGSIETHSIHQFD